MNNIKKISKKSAELNRSLSIEVAALALINCLIGFFLYGIGFAENLIVSLLYSQCIGGCIYASVLICYRYIKILPLFLKLVAIFLALIFGAFFGIGLSHIVRFGTLFGLDEFHSKFNLQVILISLLCGTIVSYIFISQKMIRESRAIAQDEKINRLAQEKLTSELELRLLQAQVEPHFLFNTLSNIHSLLDIDQKSAARMLLNLTDFLRNSLALCRKESILVGDEVKVIKSYLEIFKVRMGKRLKYEIIVQQGLGEKAIPPMLIQPLVENSLLHGLEPNVEGGKITVKIGLQNENLLVEVVDTGVGPRVDKPAGVGTLSVLQRLHNIYGNNSSMKVKFEENTPCGLKVSMSLPPLPTQCGNA